MKYIGQIVSRSTSQNGTVINLFCSNPSPSYNYFVFFLSFLFHNFQQIQWSPSWHGQFLSRFWTFVKNKKIDEEKKKKIKSKRKLVILSSATMLSKIRRVCIRTLRIKKNVTDNFEHFRQKKYNESKWFERRSEERKFH